MQPEVPWSVRGEELQAPTDTEQLAKSPTIFMAVRGSNKRIERLLSWTDPEVLPGAATTVQINLKDALQSEASAANCASLSESASMSTDTESARSRHGPTAGTPTVKAVKFKRLRALDHGRPQPTEPCLDQELSPEIELTDVADSDVLQNDSCDSPSLSHQRVIGMSISSESPTLTSLRNLKPSLKSPRASRYANDTTSLENELDASDARAQSFLALGPLASQPCAER